MNLRTLAVLGLVLWLPTAAGCFRPGERIEMVGSRDDSARDTFVARELHTADQVLVVRDAEGRPLWN